jgi:hypothetical protein
VPRLGKGRQNGAGLDKVGPDIPSDTGQSGREEKPPTNNQSVNTNQSEGWGEGRTRYRTVRLWGGRAGAAPPTPNTRRSEAIFDTGRSGCGGGTTAKKAAPIPTQDGPTVQVNQ